MTAPRGPILFTRPDPTQFALLVVKTGRGTGTVVGTEHCKPGGTEWASDDDLWDAGYTRRDVVSRMANNLEIELAYAVELLERLDGTETLLGVVKAINNAMLETAHLKKASRTETGT